MMIPGAIRPIIDLLGAKFMKGQEFTNELVRAVVESGSEALLLLCRS